MKLLTKARYTDEANDRELRNLDLAYRAACESVVLLENRGVLPLETKTVAVYGAGASKTVKGGTGSGEVNERRSVTVLEGLRERGFTVTSERWLADYEADYAAGELAFDRQRRQALKKLKIKSVMDLMFANYQAPAGRPITQEDIAASNTDSCIYVLRRQAGEGADRKPEAGDYCMTAEELEHIRTCAAAYPKFVLVINCGGTMDLSPLDDIEGIGAVVYMCQLGTQGGLALADVLSGTVTPSGKTADTWAKNYDQVPFGWEYSSLNGNLEREYYKEDIYVGYRYYDSFGVEPRYPFGYGLSYTDFAVTSSGIAIDGSVVTVRGEVRNTGAYRGKETVQLYVSAPGEQCAERALAAFVKTPLLACGERTAVELQFDMKDMAMYVTEDGAYVLERGLYILHMGTHSRNTVPVGAVEVETDTVVSVHNHICPQQDGLQVLHREFPWAVKLHPGLPRLTMDAKAIETVYHDYVPLPVYPNERVQRFVEALTVEEMAEIVVGIGMFGGTTRFTLPGSVGNTTSAFWDRGLANMTLCDGPAGLRIQKISTVTKKEKVKAVELPMSVFEMLPGFAKALMKGNPKKEPMVYQYTTAFPVSAALAQTWNEELMYEVGCGIFEEMKEYGCTYWLAPAVNIHRNPLCGRNFEYWSEDPFLAGTMAAAVVRGVQREPGYYVTVKHFAANNQEDNRNQVSSEVTERALREIYLRPFEIAVRKGGAKGIMTSYNRINGVYAPNSHDLCTKVLRNEWGFDGVVMTDWFSTNGGQADNGLAIAAGNDLIMPGGKGFKKKIIQAVKKGRLPEEDLRRCCARVVKAIFESNIRREYLSDDA
ncbi:MAG: glycoside hydrolase family 3 C-terminal domain-containing protein [Oscillospiraceae bacterium]|nr:glycoside hydrolase family 3 C-terminal domain-containing protein [Oscillospiraceae bacterium]